VKPYFRQCAPPEFSATLPPIEQTCWRRIGRVVVAEWRHVFGDVEVRDAGFDRHALVRDIDVHHAVETRQRDDEAAGDRQRSARQPGSMTAGDERHTRAGAQPHDLLDLRGRGGQRHRGRRLAQVRQGVALIRQQLERIVEDVRVADNPPQIGQKRAIHVFVTACKGSDPL